MQRCKNKQLFKFCTCGWKSVLKKLFWRIKLIFQTYIQSGNFMSRLLWELESQKNLRACFFFLFLLNFKSLSGILWQVADYDLKSQVLAHNWNVRFKIEVSVLFLEKAASRRRELLGVCVAHVTVLISLLDSKFAVLELKFVDFVCCGRENVSSNKKRSPKSLSEFGT